MSEGYYLVLDQGGQSSRALIFDGFGELLSEAAVKINTSNIKPGWVEQDPDQLVSSLLHAASEAIGLLSSEQVPKIVSAGLVTQRSSLVCWDKETGQALYPVISWQDRRAADWLNSQALDSDWVQRLTGLQLSPHYGASKIRWCLEHAEPVKQAFREDRLVCGPLAAFLISRLTASGKLLVDPANASRTLLWNIDSADWDPALLDCFDIPAAILPKIVPTQFDFGFLTVDGVKIPLKLVNGDQSAALFANGPLQPDTAYLNIGTGAFIAAPWPDSRDRPCRLLKSLVHLDEQRHYVVEGTVNGAASALDWFQRSYPAFDAEKLDSVIQRGSQRHQQIPLFINGIGGLGSPFWCDVAPEFIGEANDEQRMTAVLESIVFMLQVNLDEMRSRGFGPDRLLLSGGLSRLDGLCQMLADLSNIKVWRPQQVEASARGAAYWLAGCPKGWMPLSAAQFDPAINEGSLNRRFARWLTALQQRLPAL